MANSIRVHKREERTVITLTGMLDHDMALNLSNIINKTMPPVLLNLERVNYVSAKGSRAILGIYQQHGQKPLLQGANKKVLDMLRLSGTYRYISVLPE